MRGFENLLTGRVIVSCSGKDEVVDLPGGTLIPELLDRAERLFGRGCLIDSHRYVRTSSVTGRCRPELLSPGPNAAQPIFPNISGGSYEWVPTPPGAGDPWEDLLYVCQKRVWRWPHVHFGPTEFVRPNIIGAYSFAALAGISGYTNNWIGPEYLVLGDPEIMRIYASDGYGDPVLIDRSKLGDWGTMEKPLPVEGRGWWCVLMDFLDPSRMLLPENWIWTWRAARI